MTEINSKRQYMYNLNGLSSQREIIIFKIIHKYVYILLYYAYGTHFVGSASR